MKKVNLPFLEPANCDGGAIVGKPEDSREPRTAVGMLPST